jgi:hypothetical protein
MAASRKSTRICSNGHRYEKSSDCPVCPICERERAPAADFLAPLAAPARRALEGAGLTTLAKLARRREAEVPPGIKAHRMPRNAKLAERAAWHLSHAKACGCREMPASVNAWLKGRKTSRD